MTSRRSRSRFFTEPIACDVVPKSDSTANNQETEFEKPRGINRVDIRAGFAQVHVSQLGPDLVENRLAVLKAVAERNVNIDFLKFTPSGLAFLVAESDCDKVSEALAQLVEHVSVRREQCILLVHAVNMRDEEGLLARLVAAAIGSGAPVDHLGDMHDRLLISTSLDGAKKIQDAVIALDLGEAT